MDIIETLKFVVFDFHRTLAIPNCTAVVGDTSVKNLNRWKSDLKRKYKTDSDVEYYHMLKQAFYDGFAQVEDFLPTFDEFVQIISIFQKKNQDIRFCIVSCLELEKFMYGLINAAWEYVQPDVECPFQEMNSFVGMKSVPFSTQSETQTESQAQGKQRHIRLLIERFKMLCNTENSHVLLIDDDFRCCESAKEVGMNVCQVEDYIQRSDLKKWFNSTG